MRESLTPQFLAKSKGAWVSLKMIARLKNVFLSSDSMNSSDDLQIWFLVPGVPYPKRRKCQRPKEVKKKFRWVLSIE